MICWIRHQDMMKCETGRVYLECQTCGRKTPGWTMQHEQEAPSLWQRLQLLWGA